MKLMAIQYYLHLRRNYNDYDDIGSLFFILLDITTTPLVVYSNLIHIYRLQFKRSILPWIFILVYNYYNGAEIIIGRVSGIFSMDGLIGAFIATLLIGGITGLLGSLSGFTFKQAFQDQLIKE